MARSATVWLASSAFVLACACGGDEDLTEILVVVDTDIGGLDRITVGVDNFSDARVAVAELRDVDPLLPRYVGLVHEGGPLGPITVVARALDDDRAGSQLVVERHARVFFQQGEVLRLDVMLGQSCAAVFDECRADRTCIDGACAPIDVPVSSLGPWTGSVPQHTLVAAPSAGTGAAAGSSGNSTDTSGSGAGETPATAGTGGDPMAAQSGEDAAASPSPDAGVAAPDAGALGSDAAVGPDAAAPATACLTLPATSLPPECHATGRTCVGAVLCSFTCAEGWANCDALPMNGCESSLNSDDNCGECGVVCNCNDFGCE